MRSALADSSLSAAARCAGLSQLAFSVSSSSRSLRASASAASARCAMGGSGQTRARTFRKGQVKGGTVSEAAGEGGGVGALSFELPCEHLAGCEHLALKLHTNQKAGK